MAEIWIVGEKGGPSGQFHTVLKSSGEIVAALVPDREIANRIARIPQTASVKFSAGRYCLDVNGVVVAVEGDTVRDTRIDGNRWNKETLTMAANLINM